MAQWWRIALSVFMLQMSFSALALNADNMPQVSNKARNSFDYDYVYANGHKAFAIAPGGSWAWKANQPTADAARDETLKACQGYTQSKCVLYALDNEIVFNADEWYKLWGPYKTKKQAANTPTGLKVGDIFPDIAFTNPQGKKTSVHESKGKVRFVHLWGCWCPPCRREFTSLIDMYRILQSTMKDKVEFVVLQLREPIEQSRQWAKENNLDALPLSDSGVRSTSDTELTLKDGSKMQDRMLARVFPSTYVVDKNGVIIFSHMGSIDDWSEYIRFFGDAVERSGK